MQTNSEARRWLTGARGNLNEWAVTQDVLGRDFVSEGTYRWLLRSAPNYGNGSLSCREQQSCVRYGDRIIIQNAAPDVTYRWLSGGRGGENRGVLTRDRYRERADIPAHYEWIVLSEQTNFEDRADGQCIENLSVVYLSVVDPRHLFLTGNRGSQGVDVVTMDPTTERSSNTAQLSYQWTMRRYDGNVRNSYGEGNINTGLRCAPTGADGGWVPVTDLSVPTTITERMGVTREFSSTFTRTSAWETSVTTMISAGFDFKGVGFDVSVAVGASFSGSVESSVSQAVSLTEEVEIEREFQPSTVWQFQFEVTDICLGESDPWDIFTDIFAPTINRGNEPCCLPGHFLDPTNPHGPCLQGSPCVCGDEICGVSKS